MLNDLIYLFLPLFRQLRIDRQPGQPAAHPDMPIRRGLLRLVQRGDGDVQCVRTEVGMERQVRAAVAAEIARATDRRSEACRATTETPGARR